MEASVFRAIRTIDKILDVMASTQQMNYKYENGVYILY